MIIIQTSIEQFFLYDEDVMGKALHRKACCWLRGEQ